MKNFEFKVEESARTKLAGMSIVYAYFSGVANSKESIRINNEVDKICRATIEKFKDQQKIGENETIKGIRTLFSRTGIDPTKERPSGEALIRRVVNGKGIYRINTVVDINNIISLSTGCPCGVYDADKIEGEKIAVIIGYPGQTYAGIGGKPLNAENRILTADEKSVFGGPTADSGRTAIDLGSKEILMLIYCPKNADAPFIEAALAEAKRLIRETTGGKMEYSKTFSTH